MIKKLSIKYRVDFYCESKYWEFITEFMKDLNIYVYNFSSNHEKPYRQISWFEMSDSNSWPMDYVEGIIGKLREAVDEEIKNEVK